MCCNPKGKSNGGMVGAAAGSVIGYGLGAKVEGILNNKLNPWYRKDWIEMGFGMLKYLPRNELPSKGGAFSGAIGFEGANGNLHATINQSEPKGDRQ